MVLAAEGAGIGIHARRPFVALGVDGCLGCFAGSVGDFAFTATAADSTFAGHGFPPSSGG